MAVPEPKKTRGGNSVPPKRNAPRLRLAAARGLPRGIDGSAGLRADGEPFKPSYVRTVRDDLRRHLLPEWSTVRASEVTSADVQAWADEPIGRGLSASKVSGAVGSLRGSMRLAVRRNLVPRNPVTELDLPASNGRRDRAASPAEAAELLAALPEAIRPIYATAFYAGLRRGELRGLKGPT